MIRTFLTIASAALTVPTIAMAAPKTDAAPAVATSSVASMATAPAATQSKPRRYCVVYTPTGSFIQRRDCRTLDAWLATGVDPRAK